MAIFTDSTYIAGLSFVSSITFLTLFAEEAIFTVTSGRSSRTRGSRDTCEALESFIAGETFRAYATCRTFRSL